MHFGPQHKDHQENCGHSRRECTLLLSCQLCANAVIQGSLWSKCPVLNALVNCLMQTASMACICMHKFTSGLKLLDQDSELLLW